MRYGKQLAPYERYNIIWFRAFSFYIFVKNLYKMNISNIYSTKLNLILTKIHLQRDKNIDEDCYIQMKNYDWTNVVYEYIRRTAAAKRESVFFIFHSITIPEFRCEIESKSIFFTLFGTPCQDWRVFHKMSSTGNIASV